MPDPVARDPYRAFAADYHWFFDEVGLRLGCDTPGVRLALSGLAPGSRVLDAACGIGLDAAALHRRGHHVVAADASPAMAELARARLVDTGADEPEVVTGRWTDLPGLVGSDRFDAVLCVGNSFAHAVSEADALDALAAFRTLLVAGGQLVVDSLDWEWMADAGDHATVEPTVIERDGVRCVRTHAWHAPDGPGLPWTLDAGLVVVEADRVSRRSHCVELFPFTRQDLRARLRRAGFEAIAVDGSHDDDRFTATARRPGRPSRANAESAT